MTNDLDPNEALTAIRRSRQTVHDRVATGGWRYDLTYSAIVAGMVGSQVLDNPFNIVGVSLGVVALMAMFQAETKRIGVRVTGVSPKQARWVAIALGLAMAVVMLGVVALTHRTDIPAVTVATGSMLAAFAIALIGSRLWRRVYRAEMRGEA